MWPQWAGEWPSRFTYSAYHASKWAVDSTTLPQMNRAGETGSPLDVTAQVIWRAVTDGSWRLRYPARGNAGLLLTLCKLLPDA
jgi:hypothetical protein